MKSTTGPPQTAPLPKPVLFAVRQKAAPSAMIGLMQPVPLLRPASVPAAPPPMVALLAMIGLLTGRSAMSSTGTSAIVLAVP